MSVANIWKLQKNTAALCRKISQNVGRTYREASGEHCGTVQNGCETLRVSAIRWFGYVWRGKLKRPPLPSGVRCRMWNIWSEDPDMSDRGSCKALLSHPASGAGCEISDQRIRTCRTGQNSGCEMSREGGMSARHNSSLGGMSYATRCKGGPSVCARCRDPSPWWHGARISIQSNSIRISQEDMWVLPYPDSLREKHTTLVNITPRTIAYPIRICCPDHWLKWASLATSFRQLATAHIPLSSDGVSGCPVWTSLPWIPKNSPKSRIALVIKKLSKHQNLTQFD